MCMIGKSQDSGTRPARQPFFSMTLPRHSHSSPPRVASILPRNRRWSLPGQSPQLGPPSRLLSVLPPSKSSSVSRDGRPATRDLSGLLSPQPVARAITTDPKASSLEPLFSSSSSLSDATTALPHTISSFDGATLNVKTTFTSEDTIEALTGRHIQVCDFCHQQGLMPLSSHQQERRRRQSQDREHTQASPALPPWPSSDDSVMPPPTWSSKSTLQNHLTRRRSQSLPSSKRPIDALLEADTDSERSTPLDIATDSSSDLGATAGTDNTRNLTMSDCGGQTDAIKESRTQEWLSSSDTLGSRPSTLTSLRAALSLGSLTSIGTQGASSSLVSLAILTFCSFTLFIAFYTLVEMRDFFARTLAEVTSIKTLVATSTSQATRSLVASHQNGSLDNARPGYLCSPWLENVVAMWLAAVTALFCVVVWEFCPRTIRQLQARLREFK